MFYVIGLFISLSVPVHLLLVVMYDVLATAKVLWSSFCAVLKTCHTATYPLEVSTACSCMQLGARTAGRADKPANDKNTSTAAAYHEK